VITARRSAAGECLALAGGGGHVDLRLREAVAAEAVTLEHIHRYVAYDIASAPKTVGPRHPTHARHVIHHTHATSSITCHIIHPGAHPQVRGVRHRVRAQHGGVV